LQGKRTKKRSGGRGARRERRNLGGGNYDGAGIKKSYFSSARERGVGRHYKKRGSLSHSYERGVTGPRGMYSRREGKKPSLSPNQLHKQKKSFVARRSQKGGSSSLGTETGGGVRKRKKGPLLTGEIETWVREAKTLAFVRKGGVPSLSQRKGKDIEWRLKKSHMSEKGLFLSTRLQVKMGEVFTFAREKFLISDG